MRSEAEIRALLKVKQKTAPNINDLDPYSTCDAAAQAASEEAIELLEWLLEAPESAEIVCIKYTSEKEAFKSKPMLRPEAEKEVQSRREMQQRHPGICYAGWTFDIESYDL